MLLHAAYTSLVVECVIMLSQQQADFFLAEKKEFVQPRVIELYPGADYARDLLGLLSNEEFLLDVSVGKRGRLKVKYQTRGRRIVILARLDVNGSTHRNPDGQLIGRDHIHFYREGYGDKWAYPLEELSNVDTADFPDVLAWFMQRCGIRNSPPIQEALQ